VGGEPGWTACAGGVRSDVVRVLGDKGEACERAGWGTGEVDIADVAVFLAAPDGG
jgi:hypothetical protein